MVDCWSVGRLPHVCLLSPVPGWDILDRIRLDKASDTWQEWSDYYELNGWEGWSVVYRRGCFVLALANHEHRQGREN